LRDEQLRSFAPRADRPVHLVLGDLDGDRRVDLSGGQPGRVFFGQDGFAFADPLVVYAASGNRGGAAAAPERAPVDATPAGVRVVVVLASHATAAFDLVTAPGVTRLALGDPATGPEGSTTLAILDIATTAAYAGEISLVLPYSEHLAGHPGVSESTLRLFHDAGTGWTEVPVQRDEVGRLLMARVAGLSPFAIVGEDVSDAPAPWPGGGVARLHQNSPNPFNPSTVIRFTLAADVAVGLDVYDLRARRVRRLVAGPLPAGTHAVAWDGRDEAGAPVASGVYFYRLVADDESWTRKMILVR
jgi:hypothetical protein